MNTIQVNSAQKLVIYHSASPILNVNQAGYHSPKVVPRQI